MTDLQLRSSENKIVQAGRPDWSLLIQEFVTCGDFSQITASSYERRLRRFESWINNQNIQIPTHQDIINYKKFLERELKSPLSVGNYLTATRQLFYWLEAELILPNACKRVKNPPKPRGFRKEALDIEQIKKLLSFDRSTLIGKRNLHS